VHGPSDGRGPAEETLGRPRAQEDDPRAALDVGGIPFGKRMPCQWTLVRSGSLFVT
jgi:hypothetical protein